MACALTAARDRPSPVDDVHRTAEKYARLDRNFRRNAWRHLEEGDLPPRMIMFAPDCASANCFSERLYELFRPDGSGDDGG